MTLLGQPVTEREARKNREPEVLASVATQGAVNHLSCTWHLSAAPWRHPKLTERERDFGTALSIMGTGNTLTPPP